MRIVIFLILCLISARSNTITIMASAPSGVYIAINGVMCPNHYTLSSFQTFSFSSCSFTGGDLLEIKITPQDLTVELGFMAHFTLVDALGQSYNIATSSDWFCNFYSAVVVNSNFPSYNLNNFDPDPNWIWDSLKSSQVVCYYQINYFYYVMAQVNIDNFFDAFEVKDANGVSKYRWEIASRESDSAWSACRVINASVKVDNGDYIYIEGGADNVSWSSSVSDGTTGLNALITIKRGSKNFSIGTSAGLNWLCADNYNKSRWGGNNNQGLGSWQGSVSASMPNRCNLGNSIWNWYSQFIVCKYLVSIIPGDPYDEYYS